MQLADGVADQVFGCHSCECLSFNPTSSVHGLFPKFAQHFTAIPPGDRRPAGC